MVVATLGWFFLVERALSMSFAVNAVLYEEVGSVSMFVFGLPVLRAIPRRLLAVRRFFDLEPDDGFDEADEHDDGPPGYGADQTTRDLTGRMS